MLDHVRLVINSVKLEVQMLLSHFVKKKTVAGPYIHDFLAIGKPMFKHALVVVVKGKVYL